MEANAYRELANEKLKYFITNLDSEELNFVDIPSDEVSALNDVSALYIYCSRDKKTYYIGQTNTLLRRHNEHLKEKEKIKNRKSIKKYKINKKYNKDKKYRNYFGGGRLIIFYGENIEYYLNYLERSLIKIFKEWSAVYGFRILNSPDGNKSGYFQEKRETLDEVISTIIEILCENNLLDVKYNNTDILDAILFRDSPFFELDINQLKALSTICEDDVHELVIIRGGAGTGKTVILNHAIAKLLGKNLQRDENEPIIRVGVCLKANIKNRISEIFEAFVEKPKDYGIFIGSWYEILKEEEKNGEFDYILVDEAQRLLKDASSVINEIQRKYLEAKSDNVLNLFLAKTKKTVLFYDEFQTIRPSDIEKIDNVNKYNSKYNFPGPNQIYEMTLKSQYRIKINSDFNKYNINYAKNYVDFIKYMLQISDTKPLSMEFLKFDYFKLVDEWEDIITYINDKRGKFPFKKSRILAGYSREDEYDGKKGTPGRKIIKKAWPELGMIWNTGFPHWGQKECKDVEAEVGAIHSVQGYDFDYVAVILGNDIFINNDDRIDINPKNYKDRKGKYGISKNKVKLKKYIQNCYYTLLTRGIYGIRLFIEDPELRKYWKARTEELKQDNR
ncbi:DNA/RNA helicase domain-containing protein [Streptococcus salivarius]|uniref:DNA/RNA helicase domain-containing protein n=1 Tax=Streptococcus salivarius TaxID=1304 RepID=UPI0039C32193